MNRILELSYKHNLSHIGSCLTTYPILEKIYNDKNIDDIVILSCGHAGVAQYVIIERHSYGLINAEKMLDDMGIHPSRDISRNISVSTGSLGCGILVAIGFALANKNRNVYCVISDGECAEGSVWEALTFINKTNLKNIFIHVNINGYSAYDSIDRTYLENRLKIFLPNIIIHQTQNPKSLGGLNAHYHIMKSESEINNIIV